MEVVEAPSADADSRPYWDGLANHTILLQECLSCSHIQFPPMPACAKCQSLQLEQVESAGGGAVYSWIVVHRPFLPAFESEVPYTLATIDLDEGPRMVARIVNPPPKHGSRVAPVFHDHETWTELRFSLSEPNGHDEELS